MCLGIIGRGVGVALLPRRGFVFIVGSLATRMFRLIFSIDEVVRALITFRRGIRVLVVDGVCSRLLLVRMFAIGRRGGDGGAGWKGIFGSRSRGGITPMKCSGDDPVTI